MLDYHLHLWPHEERRTPLSVDQIAAYCERAAAAGVTEVALTEHLFRFVEGRDLLGEWWRRDEPSPVLQASMARYFEHHAHASLDDYVATALAAREAGLPVVVGLEVDFHRGRMDKVAGLLAGYPFDVLLGSVHWVGAWRFDDVDDAEQMAEWPARDVDRCWDDYTAAVEELAASGTCDVLAHPDLVKAAGIRPEHPGEWWDRLAEAARSAGMAAELSSAGWRKPGAEQYPAVPLLERFVAAGVPLTTASDAHRLVDVADRAAELRAILDGVGVSSLQAYRDRRPHPVPVGGPAVPATGGASGHPG